VAALDGNARAIRLAGVTSVLELARSALEEDVSLSASVTARLTNETIELPQPTDSSAGADLRVLAPVDHPDPAHLHLTGTGLTHLGSAASRDKMHALAAAGAD